MHMSSLNSLHFFENSNLIVIPHTLPGSKSCSSGGIMAMDDKMRNVTGGRLKHSNVVLCIYYICSACVISCNDTTKLMCIHCCVCYKSAVAHAGDSSHFYSTCSEQTHASSVVERALFHYN